MLTAHELAGLCERLGLSAQARAVKTIRASLPTRRVRSAVGNVSVRYPSRKMGLTSQAESHRVELAGRYEHEHDLRTLEFYDQPPAIKRRPLAHQLWMQARHKIASQPSCDRRLAPHSISSLGSTLAALHIPRAGRNRLQVPISSAAPMRHP
jgi:hypothetical protein